MWDVGFLSPHKINPTKKKKKPLDLYIPGAPEAISVCLFVYHNLQYVNHICTCFHFTIYMPILWRYDAQEELIFLTSLTIKYLKKYSFFIIYVCIMFFI